MPAGDRNASGANICAIVLAAGAGHRFGGRKQFAVAAGRSLLDWSCAAVTPVCEYVVVVLPAGDRPRALPGHRWQVVIGGATRRLSVAAGLDQVPASVETVVVHDAAHPVADPALVSAVLAALAADDRAAAAVPVLPVHETLIRAAPDGAADALATGRGSLQVQMPQAFRTEALRRAAGSSLDTPDEASMLVLAGERVLVTEGSPANIHVTSASELAFAGLLLRHSVRRWP